MRIVIGEIAHETNTFCPGQTTESHFRARGWASGREVIERYGGIRSDIGGMIVAGNAAGHELVPTLATWAEPWGTIAKETYDMLLGELLDRLRAAQATGPVDAVCLALHGAGVAEGRDDLEGSILTAVRDVVGPATPVIVTLDLHGNVTQTMVDEATVLLGCHLYPHVDAFERGVEAIELAARIARGEISPTPYLVQPPMLIPTSTTDVDPAKAINAICAEWEARPGIIDCTFMHGFPYTDIPRAGVSIVVTADGDPALARTAARAVAGELWDCRDGFTLAPISVEEAIAQAQAVDGEPVVINETADNPGGGAPGDATHLLRALLAAGVQNTCFGAVYDPDTARAAHAAGVEATIDVSLGGKSGPLFGAPVDASATVVAVSDGRFEASSYMMAGMPFDLGPSCLLRIDGVDVVVTSRRSQVFDPEIFKLHGLDVTTYKIVGLKSSQHFRAGFLDIAAEIIRADTPGTTSIDLLAIPYERLDGAFWPRTPDLAWDATSA